VSGGTRSLSITFNSSDTHPLTSLSVTTDLRQLPAGWSGPTSFSCANVTTGSGCVLNLTYAPTGASSGTFNIDYRYTNDLGQAKTGRESIAYSSTANNNVVATAAPTGQVTAVAGEGSQSVNVTFTTDDGVSASALQLTTPVASLPAGWSTSNSTFACDTVNTGNGCQLSLTYAPAAGGNGTLTLDYTYQDNSGASKSGSVNIAYAGTTRNNVNSTVAPSGQIAAVVGGSGRPVHVTFNTDDGFSASALQLTTALASLPSGWSTSNTTFNCDSVSTGNGCQLSLTYAPTAASNGTLTLGFTYRDNTGTSKNGSINIPYTATTSNNVNGAVAPTGQINAIMGGGTQPVHISFAPDDNSTASDFEVTTDLTALPPGWQSLASTLACPTVSTALPCELPLVFSPTAIGPGSLILNYSYRDNSGAGKTGSVTVSYVATVSNNIAATASASSITVRTAETQSVTITYATDDGNPATSLAVTNLSALPLGWSGPSDFTCANVTGNSNCQMSLTYAPTIAATGTLTLYFNYRDNSGTLKSAAATVDYIAEAHVLYISHSNTDRISQCELNVSGLLQTCIDYGVSEPGRVDLGYRNNRVYYAVQGAINGVGTTALNGTGNYLGGGMFGTPLSIAVHPAVNALFFYDSTALQRCTLASNGFIQVCASAGTQPLNKVVFSPDGARAYSAYQNGGWRLQKCNVSSSTLSTCIDTGSNTAAATMAMQVVGTRLYSLRNGGGLMVCPINADGTLGACVATATGESVTRAAFTRTNAYLTTNNTHLRRCPILSDGTLDTCSSLSDAIFGLTSGITAQ
jgi:hypothetical protein